MSSRTMYMTDEAIKQAEEQFKLEAEAVELLAVIAAEFESDPMSVQCFDSRTVERAKAVSKRLSQIKRSNGSFRR